MGGAHDFAKCSLNIYCYIRMELDDLKRATKVISQRDCRKLQIMEFGIVFLETIW